MSTDIIIGFDQNVFALHFISTQIVVTFQFLIYDIEDFNV